MASAEFWAQRARDLRGDKPELVYDPETRCWNEKIEQRRNFAAEVKAKHAAEKAALEKEERERREEQESIARSKEWQERELALSREKAAARATEIREWRARQRGEYLKDPKFDSQQARWKQARLDGGYEVMKKLGQTWKNAAVVSTLSRWRRRSLLQRFGDLDRGINCLKQFEAGAGITCVKIADNCLFAGCKIDVVHCWDMPTGRPINAFFGHKRMVNAIEIVGGLRPGGRLYTASSDCTVKEWDLDPVVGSYQCFRTFEAEGVVMSVKVFAGAIYAGCWDRKICKYNLESAVCEQVLGPQGSHEAALSCMDIMNVKAGDLHGVVDLRVYSGGHDNNVLMWNGNKGIRDQRGYMKMLLGATDKVDCVYCCKGYVYVGSRDKLIRKYHATSGECYMVYKGHAGRITALHHDGRVLYSGSQDNTVKFWAAGTGDCLFTMEHCHANEVTGIDIKDGVLITGGNDGYAKVWPLSETMFDDWWKCQDDMIRAYCERYDFDGGGTINDNDEFGGATFNLVFKLGLCIEHETIQAIIDAVGDINDDNEWSFTEFLDWFRINFM